MKFTIVGGGPAGLWFGLLAKKRDPKLDVEVIERHQAGATFGFGVVYSRKTTDILKGCDETAFRMAEERLLTWDDVDVVHRGTKISVGGNHFAGVARLAWLQVLQERARAVGVALRFEQNVPDADALRRLKGECDVLVGADGVASLVRETWKEDFEPTLDARRNRYVWLGTRRKFGGLTLIFKSGRAGLYMAHAYRFSPDTSTFIAELPETTWRAAGLDSADEAATLQHFEEVFAEDLGGERLISNRSRWIQFLLVKCKRWVHENVVILGDAAHTAHFSIGSGTKLAMEDSIALHESFAAHPKEPRDALAHFERTRKPVVDAYQESAFSSTLWFENAAEKLALDPVPFAYDCMTRSGRIDLEKLRRRDPAFVARYEEWRARR